MEGWTLRCQGSFALLQCFLTQYKTCDLQHGETCANLSPLLKSVLYDGQAFFWEFQVQTFWPCVSIIIFKTKTKHATCSMVGHVPTFLFFWNKYCMMVWPSLRSFKFKTFGIVCLWNIYETKTKHVTSSMVGHVPTFLFFKISFVWWWWSGLLM